MRLSLVSDGTAAGTFVTDGEGNPVEGITSVTLSVQPGETPKAAFTVDMMSVKVAKAEGIDISRPRIDQGFPLLSIRSLVPNILSDDSLEDERRSVLAEAHRAMLSVDMNFDNDYYYAPALIHILKVGLIHAIAQEEGWMRDGQMIDAEAFDALAAQVGSVYPHGEALKKVMGNVDQSAGS